VQGSAQRMGSQSQNQTAKAARDCFATSLLPSAPNREDTDPSAELFASAEHRSGQSVRVRIIQFIELIINVSSIKTMMIYWYQI